MYDCIIIGMGASGMSAGIYAKRSNLKTLILEENMPGGILNKVSKIENYLGFKSISGSDLAYSMFEHINNENIEYKITKVLDIKDNKDYKTIYTTKGEFKTKGIIISIGRKLKKSGLLNEEKFLGKGISYCAVCDAPLYKGKNVVVLGSNASAVEEAIYLSDFASTTKIITNKEILDKILIEKLNNKNIEIINNRKVTNFIGKDKINGVELDNNEIISADGVFIYYGYSSDTSFLKDLDITDEKGYIIVDNNMKTKHKYIYACGDIIKKELYQVSTAVSEGALAGYNLSKELKEDNL